MFMKKYFLCMGILIYFIVGVFDEDLPILAMESEDHRPEFYIDDINESNKHETVHVYGEKLTYSILDGYYTKEALWNRIIENLKNIRISTTYRFPYWSTVKLYPPNLTLNFWLFANQFSADVVIDYGARVMYWPTPAIEWSDSMRVKYLRLYLDKLYDFAETANYISPDMTAPNRAMRKNWAEEVERTENLGYRASALSELRRLALMMENSYTNGKWEDNARLWRGLKTLRAQMEREVSFDIDTRSYESRDIVLPVVSPVQKEDYYQKYWQEGSK